MNTSSTSPSRTSITAVPKPRGHRRMGSASASIAPCWMSSIGWRSAKRSTAPLTSCRPTLMRGSPSTTSTGPIRAAGASARRRCRAFLTRYHWQRKNSWRHDHRRQPIGSNNQHPLSDQVSANTDQQTQEIRDLLRTRKQLTRERSRHVQRLQKTLEDANIKLDSEISDIMGLSGRKMIEALTAGESDPERLAQLAHRRIKATPEALCEALRGRVTRHHRFLLRLHLQQIDAIDEVISDIDREVDALVEPFRTTVLLLTTIPGIDELSACVILAEIGSDMSRFPTAGHLISWAGLCPRRECGQAALDPNAQRRRLAQ